MTEDEEWLVPATFRLLEDPACAGTPIVVYRWLQRELLTPIDFAPVKVAGVATCTGLSPGAVRRALRILEAEGYLDVREAASGAREYRLYFNQMPAKPPKG